jgi:hypothetical protein
MASDSLSLARWFRALCAGEVVSAASLGEMTDFDERPEYGLGIIDRRGEYGWESGALGHTGLLHGFSSAALCFQDPGIVVVVLANAEHDVDTTAGNLVSSRHHLSERPPQARTDAVSGYDASALAPAPFAADGNVAWSWLRLQVLRFRWRPVRAGRWRGRGSSSWCRVSGAVAVVLMGQVR